MSNCQNREDRGNGHKCELVKPSSPTQEDNMVKIQKGLTLNVPEDFFDGYDSKGSVFKLRTIDLTEDKIAVKWVRKSHRCGFGNHIETLQNAADTTSYLLTSFKKRVDTKGWDIKVVTPLQGSAKSLEIGIEPFLENLELFNTNSFWECNVVRTYQKLVVALSHFSYAASKGGYVLTNLQGVVDEKHKIVTLLSPNLVSEKTGKFGCMDVGVARAFFNGHTCNSFCQNIPRPQGENKDGFVFHFPQN